MLLEVFTLGSPNTCLIDLIFNLIRRKVQNKKAENWNAKQTCNLQTIFGVFRESLHLRPYFKYFNIVTQTDNIYWATVHWTIHQTAASPDNAVKFTDTHFASEIFTMRKRTACHPLKAILKIISTRRLTVTTSQPRKRRWTPWKTTSCSASALRDKETSGSTAARAGTLATCASLPVCLLSGHCVTVYGKYLEINWLVSKINVFLCTDAAASVSVTATGLRWADNMPYNVITSNSIYRVVWSVKCVMCI